MIKILSIAAFAIFLTSTPLRADPVSVGAGAAAVVIGKAIAEAVVIKARKCHTKRGMTKTFGIKYHTLKIYCR